MGRIDFNNKGKTLFSMIGIVFFMVLFFCIVTFASYTNKLKEYSKQTTLQKNNAAELLNNALDLENDKSESASSKIGKTVDELEKERKKENEDNKVTKYTNTDTKKINNKSENKTKKTEEVIQDDVQDPVFLLPIENGEIIRKYAKDSFIYSDTLEEWITHLGVDIKADVSTVVKASAVGTVKSIKNDPRYGLTVIIEHTNGYKTVYANLLTAEFVEEGENVEQGQTLGTVGKTATFEVADEPHLHFEIIKDDENVDPEIYLKR